MLSTPIGRLRLVGILEGISFLVLLGIAMPLKYLAGQPEAVKVVGWAHGALFVLYVGAVMQAALAHGWGVGVGTTSRSSLRSATNGPNGSTDASRKARSRPTPQPWARAACMTAPT